MSKIMYLDREYGIVDNDVRVYTASWTATSSNANQVKVTDSLSLPAGIYIGIIKAPVCSQTSTYFAMRPTPSNYSTGGYVNSQQIISFEFTLAETTTVDIVTNMSTATTYSNIDRGWFKAIRLRAMDGESSDIIESGASGIWTYRKWSDGTAECWGHTDVASTSYSANGGYKNVTATLPSGLFIAAPDIVNASGKINTNGLTEMGYTSADSASQVQTYIINRNTSAVTQTAVVYWNVKGKWK